MKKSLKISLSVLFLILCAALVSQAARKNLPSTIAGLHYGNAHFVAADQGKAFRGSEPKADVQDLKKFRITNVLIIKKDVSGEVKKETDALDAVGIKYHKIPIEWDSVNLTTTCEQFIEALQYVRQNLETPGRRLYFHCTAGEDRTGVLAGLTRLLQGDGNMQEIFRDEMCRNGFADGMGKVAPVSNKIYAALLPVYQHLASAISNHRLTWSTLNKNICSGRIDSSTTLRCR